MIVTIVVVIPVIVVVVVAIIEVVVIVEVTLAAVIEVAVAALCIFEALYQNKETVCSGNKNIV